MDGKERCCMGNVRMQQRSICSCDLLGFQLLAEELGSCLNQCFLTVIDGCPTAVIQKGNCTGDIAGGDNR